MTDEAYIFNQTNRERKSIGRNALYKKNGSKSKKCSLPSDNLSKKQLKGLCGTIMTYNMKNPSYREFKTYPKDIQQEVINLHAEHGGRIIDLARTLGLSDSTILSNYINRKELNNVCRKGKSESIEYVDWIRSHTNDQAAEEFVETYSEAESVIEPLRAHDIQKIKGASWSEILGSVESPDTSNKVMSPADGRLRFDGDVETITNTIKVLLGGDSTYHIDISFYKK